jgi:lysozyme family protein
MHGQLLAWTHSEEKPEIMNSREKKQTWEAKKYSANQQIYRFLYNQYKTPWLFTSLNFMFALVCPFQSVNWDFNVLCSQFLTKNLEWNGASIIFR